jgi:hypothetical protein
LTGEVPKRMALDALWCHALLRICVRLEVL